MDSTRTAAVIAALVGHLLTAGTAYGQSFDDEALRRDAENLGPQSRRLPRSGRA